jgi:16S rRNA (cytosine967-C5)-methyltransferase
MLRPYGWSNRGQPSFRAAFKSLMPDHQNSVLLWRQLQGAASLLMAVRNGKSMTAALESVEGPLRPGVQALGFHVLRWLGRAEAIRQQLAKRPPPPEADALLCVAIALVWTDVDAPYTAHTLVDQAVEAAKRTESTHHQASFINGCLRRFLRERDEIVRRTEKNPQAVWNHPQWWIDRVRKDHPGNWQDILLANNTRAPLILRINRRKTSAALYLQALEAMNIGASLIGEAGVVLASAHPVTVLPGFAEGHFSVQDAAAQLAAPLLVKGLVAGGGRHALRILDACAAPGGKTAHLLELVEGDITALDIDGRRCERIAQNLQRLDLQAKILVADAGKPGDWWDGNAFDGILLDAPCTASGIVRRHPDVRWLRRPTDIAQLADIQRHLLETLWPLVRPGGRLLYCTCSIFHAEGDTQIQTFVARHTDALLMPSPGHLLPQIAVLGTVFQDNLQREHDGFYYALLQKHAT